MSYLTKKIATLISAIWRSIRWDLLTSGRTRFHEIDSQALTEALKRKETAK